MTRHRFLVPGLLAAGVAAGLFVFARRKPAGATNGPTSALLIPAAISDTTASDIQAAVEPQLSAIAAQIDKLRHPLENSVPGVSMPAPGPAILIAGP